MFRRLILVALSLTLGRKSYHSEFYHWMDGWMDRQTDPPSYVDAGAGDNDDDNDVYFERNSIRLTCEVRRRSLRFRNPTITFFSFSKRFLLSPSTVFSPDFFHLLFSPELGLDEHKEHALSDSTMVMFIPVNKYRGVHKMQLLHPYSSYHFS